MNSNYRLEKVNKIVEMHKIRDIVSSIPFPFLISKLYRKFTKIIIYIS